ncbi:MAG: hypothetical protein AAGG07_00495 [Planctomycetota bacterium]
MKLRNAGLVALAAGALSAPVGAQVIVTGASHEITGSGSYFTDVFRANRGIFGTAEFVFDAFSSSEFSASSQQSAFEKGYNNLGNYIGFVSGGYEFEATASSGGFSYRMDNTFETSNVGSTDYASFDTLQITSWTFALASETIVQLDSVEGYGLESAAGQGSSRGGSDFPYSYQLIFDSEGTSWLEQFGGTGSAEFTLPAGSYTLTLLTQLDLNAHDTGQQLSGTYGHRVDFRFIPTPASSLALLWLGFAARRRR